MSVQTLDAHATGRPFLAKERLRFGRRILSVYGEARFSMSFAKITLIHLKDLHQIRRETLAIEFQFRSKQTLKAPAK
jgi:hypothetical protein